MGLERRFNGNRMHSRRVSRGRGGAYLFVVSRHEAASLPTGGPVGAPPANPSGGVFMDGIEVHRVRTILRLDSGFV